MSERGVFVWIALGAIALGWFLGRGAPLPELPKLPSPSQGQRPAGLTDPETGSADVNELWDQVKGQIGENPQAAIDTVRMWRERAAREMNYESDAPSFSTPVSSPPPSYAPVIHQAPPTRSGSPVYATAGTALTWIPASASIPAEPSQIYLPTHVSVSEPAR